MHPGGGGGGSETEKGSFYPAAVGKLVGLTTAGHILFCAALASGLQ